MAVAETFQKIERDFAFLAGQFAEVLRGLGEEELAAGLGVLFGADAPPARDRDREIQALSIAFQILNLVEENSAAQARRAAEAADAPGEPGQWQSTLEGLLKRGLSAQDIREAIARVEVEPVLTAHPTEAKRPVVLHIHRQLYLLLVQLENRMWTAAEREEIHAQIRGALERLWRTGEIFLQKPSVISELENVLYYLREVFPAALGRVDTRLRQAWQRLGLEGEPALPSFRFGTWVGGDRDGHPFVTPEVTRETLARLRAEGADVLSRLLGQMAERLTLTSTLQAAPPALAAGIERLAQELGDAARPLAERHTSEPWRHFAALAQAKVAARGYRRPAELLADLALLRGALEAVRAHRLAGLEVAPVARAVECLGLQLASLDIRQNSAVHEAAIAQLLAAAGFGDAAYAEWDEPKRLAFLEAELRSPRPLLPRRAALGAEAAAAVGALQAVADHAEAHGPGGIGAIIVSMTRRTSDLLAVYVLAREVGLLRQTPDGPVCDVPVVPLFETIDDLERAPQILREFIAHPITRRSLGTRRPIQQAMIGYSDSNKDGGFLASLWGLHRGQAAMAEAARALGVELRFFHGRGGTTSRGAGPIHRSLEALPAGSLTGPFRVTEQGETIAQKYANLITATHHLELLGAGVLGASLAPARDAEGLHRIAEFLARESTAAYRALLESPGFIEYFGQATPIDALEASSIGSRPSRRTARRTLADLRAIPWVFSWNQSRHYLPGWFGLGTALARLREAEPGDFRRLAAEARRWPFLRNALYNAETSLASASMELAAEYAGLVANASVRDTFLSRIRGECERSETLLDEVFAAPRAERRPRMVRTLRLRDAGLRRLHAHQVSLLREWRTRSGMGDADGAARLFPSLLLTINAIASGERTTG